MYLSVRLLRESVAISKCGQHLHCIAFKTRGCRFVTPISQRQRDISFDWQAFCYAHQVDVSADVYCKHDCIVQAPYYSLE